MQSSMNSILFVFTLAMVHFQCGSGFRRSGRVQSTGVAETDQQDAAAIRGLERRTEEEARDSEALGAAARAKESGARAEEEEAASMAEDGETLRKTALLEYARHMVQAKKELWNSTENQHAAAVAASAEEKRELADATAIEDAAKEMKSDAAATLKETAEEAGDSRAIAIAANATRSQEEADARLLEAAAKEEQRQQKQNASAVPAQQRPQVRAPEGGVTLQDELVDAASLRNLSIKEQAAVKEEWTEADDEGRDARALTKATMDGYVRLVQRAKRELRGQPAKERAAEDAAEKQEREELADAHHISKVAEALRKDAEATAREAQDAGADASAIESVARRSGHGHR